MALDTALETTQSGIGGVAGLVDQYFSYLFAENAPTARMLGQMSTNALPRHLLKWVLSLDLTYPIKHPRRYAALHVPSLIIT